MLFKKNISIIVQARLTSSRLPDKVLKKISKKTIIEIIHQRLSHSRFISQIVYAIPKNKKNLRSD